ncbi:MULTISPECIES: EAL domain-containing protein [unclassified Nitratiruptor]|uniref:EAL domain-containing protein n=1 Tax=unclassified Nitratiruptor TaxID=2624044 RepID=UPI00191546D2|nr:MULTISPECIES: bifunctional diguanylate cyclase/phosphodiesterase [unclassified Nitratiruptor]BCD61013.1 diguanylate cyclase/phosphodiesterase [Nitratiruptor sp. YY08-10]BCD64945.1 diguanylate cyclase/phosphodiesterase [Nitratiruptor sp. YY08-14]
MKKLRFKHFALLILIGGFFLTASSIVIYANTIQKSLYKHYYNDIKDKLLEIKIFLEDPLMDRAKISTYLDRIKNSSQHIEAIYILDLNGHIVFKSSGNTQKFLSLQSVPLDQMHVNIFQNSQWVKVEMPLTMFDEKKQQNQNMKLFVVFRTDFVKQVVVQAMQKQLFVLIGLILMVFLILGFGFYYFYTKVLQLYLWTKQPEKIDNLHFVELNEIEHTIYEKIEKIKSLNKKIQEAYQKEKYLRTLMELVSKINETMVREENFEMFLQECIQYFKEYIYFQKVYIVIGQYGIGDRNIDVTKALCVQLSAFQEVYGNLYIEKDGSFLQEEVQILEELGGDIAFAYHAFLQRQEKESILLFDRITNLPNLSYFFLYKSKFTYQNFIYIDIYHFRLFNELFGIEFGDKLLKKFSEELKRFNVPIFHAVTDQFFTLFNGSLEEAKEFSTNLVEYFDAISLNVDGVDIDIHIHCAIIDANVENALQKAYFAVKIATLNNPVAIYDPNQIEKQHENFKQKYITLKQLIKNKKVRAFKQYVIDNKTQQRVYCEILARIDNDGTIITPYYFMDIAKTSGLYFELVKQMYEYIFSYLQHNKTNISINISFQDIENEKIRIYLLKHLKKYGEYITIEILETEYIETESIIKSFLQEAKRYGVKIAIDDFGSGYANFDYVLKLGADYIKIDGSLIKNLSNEVNYTIVKHIVSLAKDLGIKTVAEFVENEEIFELVKELGIDYSQGYYFHKPDPLV